MRDREKSLWALLLVFLAGAFAVMYVDQRDWSHPPGRQEASEEARRLFQSQQRPEFAADPAPPPATRPTTRRADR